MNFSITGHCSRCGSPMWSPTTWSEPKTPPPTYTTCSCIGNSVIIPVQNVSSLMTLEKTLETLTAAVKSMEERLANLENQSNEAETAPKRKSQATILKD